MKSYNPVGILNNLISYFIPSEFHAEQGEYLRARLIVISSFVVAIAVSCIVLLRQFFISPYPIGHGLVFIIFLLFQFTTPYVLKKLKSLNFAGFWSIIPFYVLITFSFYMTGGAAGPALIVLPITILMGVLYGGGYLGKRVFFITVILGIVMCLSDYYYGPFESHISDPKKFVLYKLAVLLFVISWLYILTRVFDKARQYTTIRSIEKSKFQMLGSLSAGVAHEINNPLTVILWQLSLIKKSINTNANPNEILTRVEKIEPMIKRISKVVENLVHYSGEHSASDLKSLDLRSTLDYVLSFCHERIINKNIQLDLQLPEREAIYVYAQKEILGEVFLNLVDNAIDAIEEKDKVLDISHDRWIRIHVVFLGDFVKISVINSGPKISKEVRAQLFTPFYTGKRKNGNAGIGLSLSQGLLHSIHGKIYEDIENKNTCFSILIPTQKKSNTSIEAIF